ncbi:MAG: hypothetical protein E7Z80_08145, partial [Methanobrevibacter thaueri]|nr:hypothetical protein [Methanobrevibacter thaueri]
MNKKGILIICLVVCLIFAFQSVGAADVDADGTNSTILKTTDNNVVNQTNDHSIISVTNGNENLAVGGQSFTQLENDISSGDVITLTDNYTYDSSTDSGLVNGIAISRSMTIIGNGNVVIDAGNQARIFNIIGDSKVTLIGITFINGNMDGNGGAITSTATLNITSCKFINNTASGDGGAIYLDHTIGTNIDGCTFTGNNVTTGSGGAVMFTTNSQNCMITNSVFTDNYARRDGAGIVFSAGAYNATITNTKFINNTAGDDGGAINWEGNTGIIRNITCYNNKGIAVADATRTSTSKGGTICLTGSNVLITESSFTLGTVLHNQGKKYETDAGAIFITGNNDNITKCEFNTCYTPNHAGAIMIIGNNTLIDHCKFINCTVEANGGSIYIRGINTTIKDSNFSKSSAPTGQGGAIHVNGKNTLINNALITNSNSGDSGGAIYIEGDYSKIVNSNISVTSSGNNGGAIYIAAEHANISGSHFSSNNATKSGGAIYILGNYATVTSSTFDNEKSLSALNPSSTTKIYNGGGAIFSSGKHSQVIDSNFTNCLAEADGGAIYFYAGAGNDVIAYNDVIGCTFINNRANAKSTQGTKGGGAIYWSEGGKYGTLKDSKFINNSVISTVKADGGAVLWDLCSHGLIDNCYFDGNYVYSTTVDTKDWVQGGSLFLRVKTNYTMSNCVLKNSWSTGEGGGAYLSTRTPTGQVALLVVNTTFINNTAKAKAPNNLGGGGAQLKEAQITVFRNVSFINNTANQGGGLAFIEAKADSNYFYDCTFIGNKATNDGGNIYSTENNNYKMNIYNALIIGGNATRGGGLFAKEIVCGNLTFINNSATRSGAIYLIVNAFEFKDMVFINNSAMEGGAIYIPTDNMKVSNCNFTGNSAELGGAIYIASKSITISNNSFTKNYAFNGGAIYMPPSNNGIDIKYSSFDENYVSNEGGAIYAGNKGSGSWHIHDCNFTKNYAEVDGGAVYIANEEQKIINCRFDENLADGNGGCVYIMESIKLTDIQTSIFENSHAGNGGAIYCNAGTYSTSLVVDNCDFINNTAHYNGGAILYLTKNSIIKYRDYNNFDNIGIINANGRTDVYATDSSTHFIKNSLFDNNTDYVLNVQIDEDLELPIITVNLFNPNDVMRTFLKLTVNITNQSGLVESVVVDNSNFNAHYNRYYNCLYVTFDEDLRIGSNYTISVEFEDENYIYKNYTANATARGEKIGQFTLLQKRIQAEISSQRSRGLDVYVINITQGYTFTHDYFGEPLDTKCMNLTDIDKPLIIYGNGWTLNAEGYSRIFNITADNVTIINLIFVNGNSGGECWDNVDIGGAIFWAGKDGRLIDSLFENNTAKRGGAVYFKSSAADCEIINTTFNKNTANTFGGAIDCNASNMGLYNTTFDSNHADTGAALCREIGATNGHGFNNTFRSNVALTNGSALAWINASSIHIDTYYFYDNIAGNSGGAIYVGQGSGNCEILNCVFDNNIVTSPTGHGGAIEWYAKEGLVLNSTFTRNQAYNGGAIYVGSDSGKINITDSKFRENYADSKGGAVSVDASGVVIRKSEFYHNNAMLGGGALYVGGEGQTNYVYTSIFEGNNVTNGDGGAIDWVASSGHIIDSRLTSNYANYGGGVYFGGNATESVITHCIFEGNEAKYKGGAIECNSSAMYLTHTLFNANVAQFGAALCREKNAKGGHGINNTFINNHAHISGPALAWMEAVNITITNYTFRNNSADVSGGAIHVSPGSHNCSIINCTFEDNSVDNKTKNWEGEFYWTAWDGTSMSFRTEVTDDPTLINQFFIFEDYSIFYVEHYEDLEYMLGVGGAINVFAANATVKNSKFKNNVARLGGAIFVGVDNGNTIIDNSIFTSNHAYQKGGAVNLHASAVNVTNSEFNDNIADEDGGALYVGGSGVTNYVTNSKFNGNKANNGHGGAIEWVASEGHILNSNFTKNSAIYGGAVYFNGDSHNSSIINVRFEGNNATKNGGAIDWNAKQGRLYNTTFISNYAGEYGAALCREVNATSGSGKNNTFIGNHAGIAGAALAWLGVKGININDYHFTNNTAVQYGGAIYVAKGSDNCVVNMSSFTGNHLINATGGYGGAIGILANNATIINSNFTDNSANNGGALWVGSDSGNTNITNVTFDRNSARINGGAIDLSASGVTLYDARFYNNTAGVHGGAVYVGGNGTTNKVLYSTFKDNSAGDHGGAINWLASAGEIL